VNTVDQDSVLATVVSLQGAASHWADYQGDATREIQRFRGQLVTFTDDGVLAVFDGPARALRFAHAIVASRNRHGAEMRGGIQTGEVFLNKLGVTGPPIEVATRLAERAGFGQILATTTVRDLVAGSGIRFDDAGADQPLAGLDGLAVLALDPVSLE
ncbi:MAG: hypothetical protein M3R06_03785, partial [Chloroflexota bacterium]|nr:hypothetical protein [Chloroflexota bacterium]